MFEQRDGEKRLPFDPAVMVADASVVFIGRVHSPWKERPECPKNMRAACETGKSATLEIDPAWREGLAGLEATSHIVILTWLDHAPRDLIVQRPRHASVAKGVFALRSPARPNPVGLHVVKVTSFDQAAGTIGLAAVDVLDGTPVIDIKPYLPSVDSIADAETGRAGSDTP